jgi:hypothetical protein
MKKHIGKIANTDQRVVVVFMQIPGKDDHALVVSTDNLPERFHNAVMDILESPEGQAERDLATVLGRRLLPDTGQNVMEALHLQGYMTAVHVDQVVMTPRPNMPFPLRGILESMGNVLPPATPDYAHSVNKYNPHIANAAAASSDDKQAIARNLVLQAEDLRSQAKVLLAEADRKQDQAALYVPELGNRANRPPANVEVAVATNTSTTTRPKAKRPAKAKA